MVDEEAKSVTFLHKLTRGSTSESYGLHCAQAAGLPMPLLARLSLPCPRPFLHKAPLD